MTDAVETNCDEAQAQAKPVWKLSDSVRALTHRNFALLCLGQLVSLTGTWMQGLALPWLTYSVVHHNKFCLGLVVAVSMIPSLLVTLPSGVYADRFSKRRIVIGTQTLLMMQAFVLAALVFAGKIQFWHLLVLGGFSGMANAIDMPTRQAMVIELVGKEDLVNAVALNSSIFNLTRIAGPCIAGYVLYRFGTGWCFLINGISYVAAIAGLLLMKNVRSLKRASHKESVLAQIAEGLQYVRRDILTRNLLILTMIATIFVLQYGTLMPAFALDVFKVGAKGQGAMVGAAGLGALIAALTVAVLGHRFKQKSVVFVGAFLAPVSLIAFSLSVNYPFALVCLVFTGFGMMMFLAVSNSIIQISSPPALVGRVMSVRAMTFFGVGWIGALLNGAMAQRLGSRSAVLIGACAALAGTLYYIVASRGLGESL